jgi:putative tricarboxylic transport membrane protein
MQRAEIACAVALLIVAGVVAREAIRLDMGWGDIGPKGGFFPFWLAVILGSSSLSVLARAVFTSKQQRAGEPFLTRERLGLVLMVLVPIALVVPLVEIIGFYLTAFLYLSFYIRWTGRKPWWVTGSISFLFPFAIYWVFEKWFLIPLPKGLLQVSLPF